jgi:CPA2 family monovalent cation:H+ antiporter-2
MGIAADIALIVVAAFLGGAVAQRLGQPLIVGYILAGIMVGPYTAGPTVVKIHEIELLAEIGVALLLFALGLEFNFRKLVRVKWIAFLGTPLQILVCMGCGWGIGQFLGWSDIASLWLGAIVALSSTMVLLKTLAAQGELGSISSRIMISMLIVQDLAFVPIMLVLTELNQPDGGVSALIGAIVRAGIFLVVMVVVGTRLMPAILHRISQWGSRELFLVAITALGLGVGYATYLAGLSFVFGAFVAGMVLSESEYSHQALSDIVPLRDIFSMIFFVSVGMLLDPRYVWQYGAVIAGLVVVIMLLKAAVFVAITRLFGYRDGIPVAVGIGLLQVGEFAFVLSRVARSQQVIDADQDNLILAVALVTMLLTPLVMRLRQPINAWLMRRKPVLPLPPVQSQVASAAERHQHAVIIGYGRVGQYTAHMLHQRGIPYVVIELDQYRIDELKQLQVPVIYGDAASAEVLHAAGVAQARLVLIAVGSAYDVESIARLVRQLAPQVPIVARAAHIKQIPVLQELQITEIVQPEFEAGLEMMRQTLLHFGVSMAEITQLSDDVRAVAYAPIAQPPQ